MNRTGVIIVWALALICSALTCAAAESVVLADLAPGRHYLQVDVSASGAITVKPLKVVRIGDGPLDPPPPGDLTGVAKIAFDEAVKINRPTESAVLAATYSEISKQVRSGSLPLKEASSFAAKAVNTVLGALGAKDRWRPWTRAIADELKGETWRTADQYADAYDALALGLNAAAGGAQDALDLGAIVKLISALLTGDMPSIIEAVVELIQSLRR